MTETVKIVVFTPVKDTERVLRAMGDAGGGKIGNYSHCSFVMRGKGRFFPLNGANPTIGKVGELEIVEEDRIEMLCEKEKVKKVISAMKKAHPYEEVAFDIIPLLSEKDL